MKLNILIQSQIILIDDQFCNIEDCPTKEDMDIGEEEDEDEENLDEEYLNLENEQEDQNDGFDEEGNETEEVKIIKKNWKKN